MNTRLRSLLSAPMLVAMLALVVSLAGVSYAAVTLPKNSVGAKQIKNGAVSAAKVKDGSLLAADFGPGELPAGTQGPRGPQGPPGAQGDLGPAGSQGIQGIQGIQGVPGASGSNASAFVSGLGNVQEFNQAFSLDGQLASSTASDVEGLSPNVATTARNLVVKVDQAAFTNSRTRVFALSVNGSQTLSCSIPFGITTCNSGTSTASIPAGARVSFLYIVSAGGGDVPPPGITARWGFTIGS